MKINCIYSGTIAIAVALGSCSPNVEQKEVTMTEFKHNSISYIELPMTKVEATKSFYGGTFGWTFTDWGPDYISFSGAEVEGGFNREEGVSPGKPGVLVVLYSTNLEQSAADVKSNGGKIVKEIFEFPGGRRFHFEDPNGNELAMWIET